MTYNQYRAAVDALVTRQVGLGIDDLPDTDVYSAYEDELSPRECASDVLEYAGWFSQDDEFDA